MGEFMGSTDSSKRGGARQSRACLVATRIRNSYTSLSVFALYSHGQTKDTHTSEALAPEAWVPVPVPSPIQSANPGSSPGSFHTHSSPNAELPYDLAAGHA